MDPLALGSDGELSFEHVIRLGAEEDSLAEQVIRVDFKKRSYPFNVWMSLRT